MQLDGDPHARLSITVFLQKEWQDILAEFGNGNSTPRYRYEELYSQDDRFKWHTVVHGHNTQSDGLVIPPFLMGSSRRIQAAVFSFMAGVMPPMPMLGRSLL